MIRTETARPQPDDPFYTKQTLCRKGTGFRGSAYDHEKRAAIAHYAGPGERPKGSFNFKAYKDLKDVIYQAYHSKCAYCECTTTEGAGLDIEHYRPKGAVVLDDGTRLPTGYYWLAGDWSNLLLSCQYCNRSNTHRYFDEEEMSSGGKHNKFPLLDESKRVRHHDEDLSQEEDVRLLLHPCLDDPEEHFTYLENGAILPARDADDRPSAMARASIDVYALHRLDLTVSRAAELNRLIRDLKSLISHMKGYLRAFQDGDAEELSDNEKEIESLQTHIHEMFAPEARFLGVKRHWLRENLNAPWLTYIGNYGIDLSELLP